MKLAIVHPSFVGVGGAEILALSQARCLRNMGFNVQVITCALDAERWRDQLDGLPVNVIGGKDWLDTLGGREVWFWRRARRLAAALADFDVAIAHNYPMSRVLANCNTRARKVWYCNEPNREIHLTATHPVLEEQSRQPRGVESEAVRAFVEKQQQQQAAFYDMRRGITRERNRDISSSDRLDILCANSNYAKLLAVRTYGPKPFEVIYPIVRFPERNSKRQGLDRSELRILVHSRLEAPKNVDTILRGFARFTAGGRRNAVLHVVGEGASKPLLRELAKELGVDGSVVFHGFLSESDLRRVYDRCEIFALLPIDEPFGMVFPEAAARGLVMLGPDHGGPFEILEGGDVGYTSNPFSPDQVAAKLDEIVTMTDAQVDSLREKADASCRARFDAQAIGPRMASVYGLA